MSSINNNNQSLYLNNKRLMQPIPTKEAVEKAQGNDDEIQTSSELAKEVDPDVVSWLALDQHLLLDMKNIKIVSTVKTESAVKADSTQSAGGTGVNGGGKTGGTKEASGSGGVVSADGMQSAGGAGSAGTTSGVTLSSGTDNALVPLNLDILFGNSEGLSSKEFLDRFDELLNSEDEAIRKFANIINDAFISFNCKHRYDKEDLLDALFYNLNNKAGCAMRHTDFGAIQLFDLQKIAIERFNEKGNIFDSISEILNSDNFYYDFIVGIDGRIDEYSQGETADCWLLAGLSALSATREGRNLIMNLIDYDSINQTITITFPGAEYSDGTKPVKITLPVTALQEAKEKEAYTGNGASPYDPNKTDYSPYSRGDNDVLAIELATEILKTEIKNGNIIIPAGGDYAALTPDYARNEKQKGLAGEEISLGNQKQIIYFLTGNMTCITVGDNHHHATPEETINYLKEIYGHVGSSKTKENEAYAAYFSLMGSASATLIDGTQYQYNGSAHAFAIVDMTSTTVTFIEPYDSEKKYTMTWEEFAKLTPLRLSASKVR